MEYTYNTPVSPPAKIVFPRERQSQRGLAVIRLATLSFALVSQALINLSKDVLKKTLGSMGLEVIEVTPNLCPSKDC